MCATIEVTMDTIEHAHCAPAGPERHLANEHAHVRRSVTDEMHFDSKKRSPLDVNDPNGYEHGRTTTFIPSSKPPRMPANSHG